MPRKFKGFLYHLDKNKAIKIKKIKVKTIDRSPKTLSEKQVLKIIENCNNLRDKLLVSLVYETGLRIGQALGLRHQDIHSWDNEIHMVFRDNNENGVRSKSAEDNIIHVSEDLMALYTEYLVYEFGDIDSDYVFINLWNGEIGKGMSYRNAVDLIKRLSKDLDISVHWHMFRHTHAKKLLTSGWDPSYVQKRLGHKNIQTTINIYGNIDDQDLKDAFDKYINKKG
jgi:integrase